MKAGTWEKKAYDLYHQGVMAAVADGEWHPSDEIHAMILGPDAPRWDRLSVSLCIDVLHMVEGRLERRVVVDGDGLLVDYEYRIAEGKA